MIVRETKQEVGKYLISALSKPLPDGSFSSAVSVRSGRGRGTHDRVLRFTQCFDTPEAALRYAQRQGVMYATQPASFLQRG